MTNVNKIGVFCKPKNGAYLIDYEQYDDAVDYDFVANNKFVEDIVKYYIKDNVYVIPEMKLTELFQTNSADRKPSRQLAADSREYIISYLYEKIPDDYYYMGELLGLINKCHSSNDKKMTNIMSPSFYNYIDAVITHVYGSNSIDYYRIDCNNKLNINMKLKELIITIYRFLNDDTDTTLCVDYGDGLNIIDLVNKYSKLYKQEE